MCSMYAYIRQQYESCGMWTSLHIRYEGGIVQKP